MMKRIEKAPVSNVLRLYRQAWKMFDMEVITKEELLEKLTEIKMLSKKAY